MYQRSLCASMLLLPGAAVCATAQAAEQQARLTIEITVTGSESASAGPGSDWGQATISQHYRLVTLLETDGVLSSVNAKDPQYAQKALAQAAYDRARIRAAQQRLDAAGTAAKGPAGDASAVRVQEMQAGLAGCGDDEACKQGVAMRYATQPGFAAALAALSQPEYLCRQQAAGDSARERECLHAMDADVPAGALGLGAAEAPPEERYLTYIGWIGCPSEIAIRIDDRLEGAYADVGGMVPYTQAYTANWSGTESDRSSLCVHYTTVLDTKAQILYTDGLVLPQIMGRATYTEPRRAEPVQHSEESLPGLPPAAAEFIHDALLVRPLSGSKHGRVTLDQPYLPRPPMQRYSGEADVDVTWSFEPL